MSAYQEYNVEFTDIEALKEALCMMKMRTGQDLTASQIVEGDALSVYGYQGDDRTLKTTGSKATKKAKLVIPGAGHPSGRNVVGGASNDIAFVPDSNGALKPVISAYDSSYYNQAWLGKLKASYTEVVAVKKAQKAGWNVQKTVENGKVKLKMTRWA